MITNCIWHKNRISIFSPIFLIGNLLHKNTKRQGWVSTEGLVAATPTTPGVREPQQSLGDGEGGRPPGPWAPHSPVGAAQEGFPNSPAAAAPGPRAGFRKFRIAANGNEVLNQEAAGKQIIKVVNDNSMRRRRRTGIYRKFFKGSQWNASISRLLAQPVASYVHCLRSKKGQTNI